MPFVRNLVNFAAADLPWKGGSDAAFGCLKPDTRSGNETRSVLHRSPGTV